MKMVSTTELSAVDRISYSKETETKGWVLGHWYMTETNEPKLQIKSKDNTKIAILKDKHYDTSGGDLF
jgi:hypothetical protein